MTGDRKPLAGSDRAPLRNSKVVGRVDPNQRIEVTVRVRPRIMNGDFAALVSEISSKRPSERTYLSREELAFGRGADPEDLGRIDTFAHAHHLTIAETSIPRRTVRLAGTAGDLSDAFGVRLHIFKSDEVIHRGRTGPVYVPGSLVRVIKGVFGLDNRPFARPHYRRPILTERRKRAPRGKVASIFSVPEVATLYRFPPGLNGRGQCIALIELNGIDHHGTIVDTGYAVADLKSFFRKLGLPIPDVSAIGVDGGRNMSGSGQAGDTEVTVDIDVAGAIAHGSKLGVYFAPDTDAGFIDAVSTAVCDTVRAPSVISISWGGPEDGATWQFLKEFNDVLQDAAAIGVTVCCETGDYGSSDETPQSRDGRPHVEFPASSPFALACGGTQLIRSGKKVSREVVWNDGDSSGASGGGVSNKFPRPPYQRGAQVPLSPDRNRGRGLPDVCGNAAGYRMIVAGKQVPVNGTSVVAPLWAGLIALINQSLTDKGGKPVGFVNPLFYGLSGSGVFKEIIEGNNDIDGSLKKYFAKPGWDPCTGLGSPDGVQLLAALTHVAETGGTVG